MDGWMDGCRGRLTNYFRFLKSDNAPGGGEHCLGSFADVGDCDLSFSTWAQFRIDPYRLTMKVLDLTSRTFMMIV